MTREKFNVAIRDFINAYNDQFANEPVEFEHFFNTIWFRNMVQKIGLFSFMKFFPIHDDYKLFDETSQQTHQVIYTFIGLKCELIDDLEAFTDKVSNENLRRIIRSYYKWEEI